MSLAPGSQIFVSSPLMGMSEWRQAAARGIELAGLSAVRLETIWPQPSKGERDLLMVERVLEKVREASALIFIHGKTRGVRIAGSRTTLVEHEINTAASIGVPILAYLTPESPLLQTLRDGGAQFEELHWLQYGDVIEPVQTPDMLKAAAERDLRARMLNSVPSRESVILQPVSRTLLQHFLSQPDQLARCPSRMFEELVADLLERDGWEVELVARPNAPGPDIFACSRSLIHQVPLRMIVECKRYRESHKVDIREVRNLVYWVNERYRATLGMLATTSSFTRAAEEEVEDLHAWRISLKDQVAIVDWLKRVSRSSIPREV